MELILMLESRMQEMCAEHKQTLKKIEDERDAERKRWADEIKAIKFCEEHKKNTAIDDMKQELHEAFRLLGFAKAKGHLDLSTAAQMLKECEQQSTSSSSSAAVEQAARDEAIAVRTVEAHPESDDLGFHIVTGEE